MPEAQYIRLLARGPLQNANFLKYRKARRNIRTIHPEYLLKGRAVDNVTGIPNVGPVQILSALELLVLFLQAMDEFLLPKSCASEVI